ncbi:MAG: response regulator [bacterium]
MPGHPETKPAEAVVLLVDDDADILDSYAMLLRHELPGSTVLRASSAAEASAIIARRPVSLMVVDFRMPEVNGLEFLRQAAKVRPGTPSLLITAYPDMDIAIEALNELHVKYYLTKPIPAERMMAAVRATLEEAPTR